MRPKLSQTSNGGVGAGATASSGLVPVPPSPPTQPTRPAPPISQSLTAQASTRETTNYGPGPSSSSTGIINPVFVSDLVEGNHSGQPPPTKPKPKKQAPSSASHLIGVGVGPAGPVGAVGVVSRPQGRTSSGSQSDASASGGSTVETTASDDNRRTLTTSSLEIGDHGSHHSHHSSHSSHPSSSGHSGASTSVKHRAVSSHQSEPSCDFCYRFHVNNHHARSHRVQQQQQQQRIPAPAASRYLYEAPPVQVH